MSDPREQLKAMLQDLINDRPEQATATIHNYMVAKTQQLTGRVPAEIDDASGHDDDLDAE